MFVRTRRLLLRPGWPEDAPAIAAAIAHESVIFRLARVPWPYAEVDAAAWLAMPKPEGELRLQIVAHENGRCRLVGGIGLHHDPARDALELGYWLTPDAWGRGYATEAGRAVIDVARHAMGLRRLVSGFHVDNPASGRVLAKLGFRDTGRTEYRPCLARGHEVEHALVEMDLA